MLYEVITKGKKGVCVLERTDQPLAEDLPLMREIRAALSKCIENGQAAAAKQALPYPQYDSYSSFADTPRLYSGAYGVITSYSIHYTKLYEYWWKSRKINVISKRSINGSC